MLLILNSYKLIYPAGLPDAKNPILNTLIKRQMDWLFRRASLFKQFAIVYHKKIGFVNNQDDLAVF